MPDEAGLNESAPRPSNASPNLGDEAGLSFDDFDNFLDNFPSSPLTMDGGMFPPPPFGVVSHTVQLPFGMFVVTINELRPRTDLYMSRLPLQLQRGEVLHHG